MSDTEEAILGVLCGGNNGGYQDIQIEAWRSEILLLKNVLLSFENYNGKIIFEYNIPRLGKRIDVVLLFP